MPKKRLDTLLVERGLADDLAQAQAFIMARTVFSDTVALIKAGELLHETTPLTVKGRKPHGWVSRGGIKLAHAIEKFGIAVAEQIVTDIGASTGGFTDVLLHKGAKKVYSVDVGYGELAWKLRNDSRVTVLERTNARLLTVEHIPEPVDMVVCDASFIGLQTVLPAALALTAPLATLVALIKPQFEVTKDQVGPKGVVTDPDLHSQVCTMICTWLSTLPGWAVHGLTESPIKGPEGNTEFLVWAKKASN